MGGAALDSVTKRALYLVCLRLQIGVPYNIALPVISVSSLVISTDVLLFFFWTLALYFFWNSLETNQWRWWLLTGCVSGMGLLTKYTMGIFAVSALLYLILTQRSYLLLNIRLLVAVLLAFLIWLPNLVWNYENSFITFRHTSEIAEHNNIGLQWGELATFLGAQVGVFGIISFILLLVFSLQITKHRIISGYTNDRSNKFLYLLISCWAFLFIISLQALLGRAYANWAAPATVAATILVVAMCLDKEKINWLLFSLLLNLVFTGIIYHYHPMMNALGLELSRKNDIYARTSGWRSLARRIHKYAQKSRSILISQGNIRRSLVSVITSD